MAQALAGLILAGGEGVRFGGPKAWARLPDGSSFLQRCATTLAAAGADPLLATLPPGSADPRLAGLSVLPLPHAGLDMLASARAGLAALLARGDWPLVVLTPVDHPLFTAATVVALAGAAGAVRVPRHAGKRGHPICLSREVAIALVAGTLPGPTLREGLAAAGRIDVDVEDAGVVANCNTPAALAAALD